MPDQASYALDTRPDYGLDRFDRLLNVLDRIYDPFVRDEIRSELFQTGSSPDVEHLARVNGLEPPIRAALESLVGHGPAAGTKGPPGSVLLASIRTESKLGDFGYDVCLFARHRRPEEPVDETEPGGVIVYEVVDEDGDSQEIATSDLPLSLRELIDLVDTFLEANAPAALGGNDWRDDHFATDPTIRVEVRSPLYPELERWYRESIDEWLRVQAAKKD